ncbi:MAG TPA: hypothetical protein VFH61_05620, partial [Thermoleophilia bacterium]|nr:hypothetical protein [Thermoleophilia bacterium]
TSSVCSWLHPLKGWSLRETRGGSVNGVPGFKVTYTYTNEDTEMQASTVFLVKGQYEYMVTSQATADRWDEMAPQLEAAAMSFTID